MSEKISPLISAAVATVWTQYMLMMSMYGKESVIAAVENMNCESLESEKIRLVLLQKFKKVYLK